MIRIIPSLRARLIVALVWAGGGLLLYAQNLQYTWVGLLLWSVAVAYWIRVTVGLNTRELLLRTDAHPARITYQGSESDVLGLRPGLITPWLATVEIETNDGGLWVIAAADGLSEESHRRLRRWLVEGLPESAQPSLGRGE